MSTVNEDLFFVVVRGYTYLSPGIPHDGARHHIRLGSRDATVRIIPTLKPNSFVRKLNNERMMSQLHHANSESRTIDP